MLGVVYNPSDHTCKYLNIVRYGLVAQLNQLLGQLVEVADELEHGGLLELRVGQDLLAALDPLRVAGLDHAHHHPQGVLGIGHYQPDHYLLQLGIHLEILHIGESHS